MSISKILEGINRDESSYTDGWWETESGASFGHEKLIEAQGYEAGLLAKITELESQVDALRKDAERYLQLKEMYYSADFDYSENHLSVITFEIPKTARVSINLDATLDGIAAIKGEQAA